MQQMYRSAVRILVLIVCFSQTASTVAQSDGANYNFIISDAELLAYASMNQQDIQRFFESKHSYLSNYTTTIDTGENVSAAELLFRTSRDHAINPKFLLALIQKEQSLIEDPAPTQNQLDWAAGYGCLDGQSCNERWRGFQKQVNSAAEQIRYYYDNINEYTYRPGVASLVDGIPVTPKNIVTAALYNYTPHIHGNQVFQAVWQRYFTTLMPDGTLVQVPGDAGVWLIKDGVKQAFTSMLALVSRYSPDRIVPIAQNDLDSYPRGYSIEFPAYSLVRTKTSGNMYLLTVDQKRLILSPEVFKDLGFNPEEVEDIDDAVAAEIPDGRPIALNDAYPTGSLLQNKQTNELWYVESGRKYSVLDKALVAIKFPTMKVSVVAPENIDKYPSGFPLLLSDGVLVKGSSPDVYVISNGKKRHITSEKVFTSIGYKWNTITVISDALLNMHPTGDPIIVS